MSTIVIYESAVHIPDGIGSLARFRRWLRSDEFPEAGRICYLGGQVWVDMANHPARGSLPSRLPRDGLGPS